MSRHVSRRSERGAGIFARVCRRSGRRGLAAAIAVPLAASGIALAAAGSAHAVAASQPICHATAPGKYKLISPSIDATGLKDGHTGHADDIIPPFDYTDSTGAPQHYPGLNWNATGQAIFNNGCAVPSTTIIPVDPTVVEANCVAGVPKPPSLTLPTTPAGVKYSAAVPAGGYAAGDTVTVTATITDPAQWFQAPPPTGWTFVDVETETYQFTFRAAPPCGAGAPMVVDLAAPTVVDATCAAGALTAPSLTPAAAPAGATVTYTTSALPPYHSSQTVIMTATITDPALTFISPATGGWTFVDSTHETYTVTFAPAPACGGGGGGGGVGGAGGGVPLPTTVAPVAPSFGDPGCGTGGATAPFVTTPSTPSGVAYTVSPSGPYKGGDTVTVTATITDPADQFAAPGTGGWTFVDSTHETIAHTFAAAPTCSGVGGVKAVAATPTSTDATCVDGTLNGASYTLPDVDGVRYTVDGRHRAAGSYAAVSGSTVTIDMTATAGYTLRDDGPVVLTFAKAPKCLGVEPTTTSRQPLADTGARVAPLVELGTLLTLLGIALLFGGRSRNRKAL